MPSPSDRRPISRQAFLAGSAVGVAALTGGCALLSTEPESESRKGGGGAGGTGGLEAPALADRVRAGSLPPVGKRLPTKPLVVKPVDRPGSYGGSWRTALLGAADVSWLSRTVGYDNLVSWDPAWTKVIPNVAESFEIRKGGAEYAFTLYEGAKWSDGKPLTSDDVVFWYDAVFTNADLTPAPATYLQADGHPVVVEKVDDRRFRFVFARPNGLFLQWLATYDRSFALTPRHYLERFHADYNPDAAGLAKKEHVPSWLELFQQKSDLWANPDLPRVNAWLPQNALGQGNRIVFERNPYYLKVDSQGRQLPYLDKVVFDVFNDEQTMLLRGVNGDLDFHSRSINLLRNKPVLARGRDKGNYRLLDMPNASMNQMILCLNLNHKNPALREVFQNKTFRVGLSHAIDRQEIIDVVYQGQGEPWQTAPRPEAPFYDSDDMAKQFTEFDVDLANDTLDKAGYAKRDGNGIRLGPSGEPIAFSILTQTRYFEMIDVLELIKKYWKAVGIDLTPKNIDGTLLDTRVEANDFDGAVDTGQNGYIDAVMDPRWFFPSYLSGASYAPLWYRWYVGEEPSEEPPAAMKEQMRLYREDLLSEPTPAGQYRVMKQIVEIARDEFWTLGICLPPASYGILRNDFHNVPEKIWEAFRYPTPGPTNPCQYYSERR